jgi:hypothetical protein
MNVSSMRTFRGTLALALVCSSLAVRAETATSRIVSAANTFLSTLDKKQRQRVLYAFDDDSGPTGPTSRSRSFLAVASA